MQKNKYHRENEWECMNSLFTRVFFALKVKIKEKPKYFVLKLSEKYSNYTHTQTL